MSAQAMVTLSQVKVSTPHCVFATQPPATIARISSATPMNETSLMRPGRRKRR